MCGHTTADGHTEVLDGVATFPDLRTEAGMEALGKYVTLMADDPKAFP
jgi:hypothetical protein